MCAGAVHRRHLLGKGRPKFKDFQEAGQGSPGEPREAAGKPNGDPKDFRGLKDFQYKSKGDPKDFRDLNDFQYKHIKNDSHRQHVQPAVLCSDPLDIPINQDGLNDSVNQQA